MDVSALLWSLITLISLLLLAVSYALVAWIKDSRSTRSKKPNDSPPPTPPSDAGKMAQLEADQAALFSTLEKLTTTVKRVSSRQGMRDLRARDEGPPPVGASKADLLRYYGMHGKLGPDFTRAQQNLELRDAPQRQSDRE